MDEVAGKQFSTLLRELIHALRIKDIEFAQQAGIKKQTLSNYVNGRSLPDWSILKDIIQSHGVNPAWLFTGEGEMFQANATQPPSMETQIKPSPSTEQTPLEREMETFVRLMRENGAAQEEIREGLKAKMGVCVTTQEEKNAPSKGTRSHDRTPPHLGVPQPTSQKSGET